MTLSLHPAFNYIFAICSLLGGWTLLGSVGIAYQFGQHFLVYFSAVGVAFFFAPILFVPILRLCKTHHLHSMADLFAFRYDRQTSGTLCAVALTLISLPLIALQFRLFELLSHYFLNTVVAHYRPTWASMALPWPAAFTVFFPAVLILVSWLLNNNRSRELHVLSLFSAVKLGLLLVVVGVIFFHTFGDLNQLQHWLTQTPRKLNNPNLSQQSTLHWSLILAWFFAPITFPHAFHLLFTNRAKARWLLSAAWFFPLTLWLVSLTVPFIVWAATKNQLTTLPEHFLIELTSHSPLLSLTTLMMLLLAIAGLLLPLLLNLSDTVQKHLVMPSMTASLQAAVLKRDDVFVFLTRNRMAVSLLLLSIGYFTYQMTLNSLDLAELGILSVLGALHFVPGLIGCLFWPKGNARGFNAGLLIGISVWLIGLLFTSLTTTNDANFWLDLGYSPNIENWQLPTVLALFLNSAAFVMVSLVSSQNTQEQWIAQQCTVEHLPKRLNGFIEPTNLTNIKHTLNTSFSNKTIETLLKQSQPSDDLSSHDSPSYDSPSYIRELRESLQSHFSDWLGPLPAKRLIDQAIPFSAYNSSNNQDVPFTEENLADQPKPFRGIAAELDQLRRYHKELLNHLPLGIVILTERGEIIHWNHSMQRLSGIHTHQVLGSHLTQLAQPWQALIQELHLQKDTLVYDGTPQSRELDEHPTPRSLNIFCTQIQSQRNIPGAFMLVFEDWTPYKNLQRQVAHADRLAAIGQLAAGVAHEIGNPVTAISCLAQEIQYSKKASQNSDDAIAEGILQQTQRISSIVQSLTSFGHTKQENQTHFEPVNLNKCIQSAVELIQYSDKAKYRSIQIACPDNLRCLGDDQLLQQMFINLLDNACDASPDNSEVQINAMRIDSTIQITVTDQGHGMPAAIKEHAFEPFTTTKPIGQGTGLGLYLAYNTLKEHNGAIFITSPVQNDRGTQISLSLPVLSLSALN